MLMLIFLASPLPSRSAAGAPIVSINDGQEFLPILKPDALSLKIGITANDWLGKKAELYLYGFAGGEESLDSLFFFDGRWQTYQDDSELKPAGIVDLIHELQIIEWTPVMDTSEFHYATMTLFLILDQEVDGRLSPFASTGDTIGVGFGGARVLTPAAPAGNLRAASVMTEDGVSMGLVRSQRLSSPEQVEFELPANSFGGLLCLVGRDTMDGFDNPLLKGVRVSLVREGQVVAGINDGQVDTSGLSTFNAHLLTPTPAYVDALQRLATALGIPNGTPVEAIIEKLSTADTTIQTVDPLVLRPALEESSAFRAGWWAAFDVPLATVSKPGNTPVLAIVNPPQGGCQIRISGQESTGSFGLW
ncbi:MAG: hypothetical protein HY650_08025 [Acidobacteria bacterium]|nr:hypothetical protein [Acidobacteriota bacterium]